MKPIFQLVTVSTFGSFMTSECFYDEMFGGDSLLEADGPALKHLILCYIFNVKQGQNVEITELWLFLIVSFRLFLLIFLQLLRLLFNYWFMNTHVQSFIH